MRVFIVVGAFVCALCEILDGVCGNLGTLRTFQAAACDDDAIQLRCPPGTRIAIELARYGRVGNQQHVCPPLVTHQRRAIVMGGTCLLPTAQQTVNALCQTKRECQFVSSASVFQGDPCQGVRKYVEVAYKCRPFEFRSRLVCQDERMELSCTSNSRIAIFSVFFGQGNNDTTACAEQLGEQETCFSSYATQTAMQACHGRRACELMANVLTFGQPCKGKTKVYLKVIYTCVPRKVLNKQYEARVVEFSDVQMAAGKISPHAKSDFGTEQVYNFVKSSSTSTTPSTLLQKDMSDTFDVNCTVDPSTTNQNKVIGFISQWINTYTFVAQNQERFYLYLILSIGLGVLLCMGLLIAHLLVQRWRARREAQYLVTTYDGPRGSSILPHGFADDISAVDADIDLDLPIVPMRPFSNVAMVGGVHSATATAPCDVLRSCHTLPRNAPRSLNAGGGTNSSFFYG